MNLNFTYYMPTRLLFGTGTLKELAQTPFLPGKKALIVIGAAGAMRKHGYLEKITALLAENNVESVVFDKIMANPVEVTDAPSDHAEPVRISENFLSETR